MKASYIDDEKNLIKYYLSTYYCENLFLNPIDIDVWKYSANIELIVRPECTQKCEYCYIYQHGDDLYPKDLRLNKEDLIKHYLLFLNMLIEHKIAVVVMDLFAGDLFYDGLFFDLADCYLDYVKVLRKNNINATVSLCIPTNISFMHIDGCSQKLLEYKASFDKLNAILNLSLSTDGLYGVDTREKSTSKITLQFYDDLFIFATKMDCGFHPMISACNIDHAIENLNWWCKMYHKYNRDEFFYPMMLYVRNGDWTPKTIKTYCEFITACWNTRFELYNKDLKTMAEYSYSHDDASIQKFKSEGFDPAKLPLGDGSDNRFSCTVQSFLHIYLSDFKIATCHRLTYPQFSAGNLSINPETYEVDINPLSVGTWIAIKNIHPLYMPKCESCNYKLYCLKGCLGAQFEYSGEVLLPIDNVCNLLKASIDTLISLLVKNGVYQYAVENNIIKNTVLQTFIESKIGELNLC